MKKSFISLILVALFTCGVIVFAACGKDQTYKMSDLKNDLFVITEENNVVIDNNKIKFDYSVYDNFDELISDSSSVYSNIEKFNTLLDNSLSFTYAYVDACATDSISANSSIKNQIGENVKEFVASAKVVSQNIGLLAGVVSISASNPNNENCMFALKNLFDSYIRLYKKAVVLNDSVTQFYYTYAISNSNPNVVSNYSATSVLNLINSRVHNQISMLTQNFLELCVFGSTISKDITTNNQTLDLSQNSYIENVGQLHTVDITQATERANVKQNEFYNLAVKLYNIQGIMENDHNKLQTAYLKVDYLEVDSNSTSQEKLCATIVEDYGILLQEYNNVLSETIALISTN